jgi:hypothetical protein
LVLRAGAHLPLEASRHAFGSVIGGRGGGRTDRVAAMSERPFER